MAIDLAFESVGSGPPLLVLHGLFGSGRNWRSIARPLGEHHTVYTVDLRNHGDSPWIDVMGYQAMADDLRQFIEQRGLGQPAVMGHSMGGKAAMALALMYPERVGTLIVVDIAPMPYADSMTPFVNAMRLPEVLASASRAEAQRRLEAQLPDRTVAPFLMQNLVTRDEHFDWRINLAAIAASMSDITGFPPLLQDLRFPRPATAIVGALSDYVPGAQASFFEPMFPKMQVEAIDGAGHWVHADQPQAFIAAVQRTLGAAAVDKAA